MEGESAVTRSINDEFHSCDFQGDEMETECGVTQSFIDQFHSSDIQ